MAIICVSVGLGELRIKILRSRFCAVVSPCSGFVLTMAFSYSLLLQNYAVYSIRHIRTPNNLVLTIKIIDLNIGIYGSLISFCFLNSFNRRRLPSSRLYFIAVMSGSSFVDDVGRGHYLTLLGETSELRRRRRCRHRWRI